MCLTDDGCLQKHVGKPWHLQPSSHHAASHTIQADKETIATHLRRITADMPCVNTYAKDISVPEAWQTIPLPLICALPVIGWTVLLALRTCSCSLRCRCGPGQDCPARLQPGSCHLWSTLLPQVRDTQFNTCCMPDHYDTSQRLYAYIMKDFDDVTAAHNSMTADNAAASRDFTHL